jgi:hypothetical protein
VIPPQDCRKSDTYSQLTPLSSPPPSLEGLEGVSELKISGGRFFESETRVRYDFDYFGVGSVEQPIDGRAPFRSYRRRNDPAVGPDLGLEVRPRNADVSGRRSGRRVKGALASTPRNAKRGDKRAHSSNPGKAQFGLRTQFGPLVSATISGACGDNMTKPSSCAMNARPKKPIRELRLSNLRLRPPKPALGPGDSLDDFR